MRLLLLCLILLIPLITHADIFKWTDANGVVHYSDTPREGASTVQLPPEQTFSGGQNARPPSNNSQPPAATGYTSVRITNPTDNYTYVNNEQGQMTVSVDIQPVLQGTDKMQVLLDGRPVGDPQAGSNLGINNVERGQHTVQVQVVGANNTVLATSNTVTFNMQRPRFMPAPLAAGSTAAGGSTNNVGIANPNNLIQTAPTMPIAPQSAMMPRAPNAP